MNTLSALTIGSPDYLRPAFNGSAHYTAALPANEEVGEILFYRITATPSDQGATVALALQNKIGGLDLTDYNGGQLEVRTMNTASGTLVITVTKDGVSRKYYVDVTVG